MKAQHTKGPWTLMLSQGFIDLKGNNGNTLIASWDLPPDWTVAGAFCEEEQANLNLIAAAPELLGELRECVKSLEYAVEALDGARE